MTSEYAETSSVVGEHPITSNLAIEPTTTGLEAAPATPVQPPAPVHRLFSPGAQENSPFAEMLAKRRAQIGTAEGLGLAKPLDSGPVSQDSVGSTQTIQIHGGTASAAMASVSTCELPEGLSFEGVAIYPCSVTVKGRVKGSVEVTAVGEVLIAETGHVEGDVKARSITVNGSVNGTVDATGGTASFGEKARCEGRILYARVAIAEGADIEATMKKSI